MEQLPLRIKQRGSLRIPRGLLVDSLMALILTNERKRITDTGLIMNCSVLIPGIIWGSPKIRKSPHRKYKKQYLPHHNVTPSPDICMVWWFPPLTQSRINTRLVSSRQISIESTVDQGFRLCIGWTWFRIVFLQLLNIRTFLSIL